MKRELLRTGDGSLTIRLPEWNEQYHSHHGAIAEALHVFIHMGLDHLRQQQKTEPLAVLEVGFGTGLNTLMTWQHASDQGFSIDYRTLEAFPVERQEQELLNYPELLNADPKVYQRMHELPWGSKQELSPGFELEKIKIRLEDYQPLGDRHLIYFDAFGPRVQPELWTDEIFSKMFNDLLPAGVLVTYSAKGSVRRSMQSVGFEVERLPGPPGKREMLRATKKLTEREKG